MMKTRLALAFTPSGEALSLWRERSRALVLGAAALVLFTVYLGANTGCKVESPPGSMFNKDMSMKGDGGPNLCETEKCSNPDSKCCNGEPCIDVKTSPIHCGDCNKVCRAREVCSNGLCVCRGGGRDDICPTDSICCSDGCHNVKIDPKNCGGCGLACRTGESCIDGQCKCGPGGLACRVGQVCCASGCTDMQNDPKNCGMCGRECPMGMCKNGLCDGECATPCAFPTKCCNSVCVDLANDPKNCRECGRDCSKVSNWPTPTCIAFICLGEKPPDMGGDTDMMSMPPDMGMPMDM